jgi:hypothetical protein
LAQSLRNARYTSRIIKAGALLPDTKLLLQNWDEEADVRANLDWVRQENLFGKASRSRVEDVLLVFKQRYLKDPVVRLDFPTADLKEYARVLAAHRR